MEVFIRLPLALTLGKLAYHKSSFPFFFSSACRDFGVRFICPFIWFCLLLYVKRNIEQMWQQIRISELTLCMKPKKKIDGKDQLNVPLDWAFTIHCLFCFCFFLFNSHTNSVFLHSRERPAPITETFFASRGYPLTRASTAHIYSRK